MRTTVTIDDAVFSDLMELSETGSRSAAVSQAVAEWVRRKKIEKLKSPRGRIQFSDDLADLRSLEVAEAEERNG